MLFASEIMHGDGRVFSEASLNVLSACDDSQEAHIGRSVVIRIIDQQFHFATDARQLDRCR
jgi:hypothetical protein